MRMVCKPVVAAMWKAVDMWIEVQEAVTKYEALSKT
jgi:hypothetical protein